MDFDTREHVKRQINAAARRKLGLPAGRIKRSAPVRVSPGITWDDVAIEQSLVTLAQELDTSVDRLTMRQYHDWREADKSRGPTSKTLRVRLRKGVLSLPRSLA